MRTLVQQQRWFAARLADAATDVAPGLGVYRRTIAANYHGALAATYPLVQALMGESAFEALVAAYVAAEPSTCGDLNVYGGSLADFIDAQWNGDAVACVSDAARLEWAIDEASRAADPPATPADVFARLQQLAPDRVIEVVLSLRPDCRLLHSRFPLMDTWQRRALPADGATGEEDDFLLVRRRDDGVQVERLAPAEHAWLTALARGETLGTSLAAALAIDPAFDVSAAVGARIVDGTLDAPRLP